MDQFLAISRLLVGKNALEPELGKFYRAVIEKSFGANILDELLSATASIGVGPTAIAKLGQIIADDTSQRLHFMSKQIVKLWLFSQFNDPEQGGRLSNAGRYGKSMFWGMVKAYPPSLSTGPHGYWSTKP
jgi:hypothetical protein